MRESTCNNQRKSLLAQKALVYSWTLSLCMEKTPPAGVTPPPHFPLARRLQRRSKSFVVIALGTIFPSSRNFDEILLCNQEKIKAFVCMCVGGGGTFFSGEGEGEWGSLRTLRCSVQVGCYWYWITMMCRGYRSSRDERRRDDDVGVGRNSREHLRRRLLQSSPSLFSNHAAKAYIPRSRWK